MKQHQTSSRSNSGSYRTEHVRLFKEHHEILRDRILNTPLQGTAQMRKWAISIRLQIIGNVLANDPMDERGLLQQLVDDKAYLQANTWIARREKLNAMLGKLQ